ncbi:hypothetical protein QVD17_37739 [Tagetes erecta]|uniref:Uncharacterized protein n=1 Tax=Tagetes erecta TaxID=13708 RepID=A0AAD8JWJ6_TARER|nr:hypothetical protein QVD17_37739 [Tagetes erecta]
MGKSSKPPVKSSLFEKLLRRRVQETYGHSIPSIEELIDGLRAKYPEYGRHKSQLFTRMVKQTLDSDINNNNHKDKWKTVRNGDELRSFNVEDDDDDDDDIASPSSRSPASKKLVSRIFFPIKLHHSGSFTKFPGRIYQRTIETFVDMLDIDKFSVHTLDMVLEHLGYAKQATRYYHYLYPNSDLDFGLRALGGDEDVRRFSEHVLNLKTMYVYVEHETTSVHTYFCFPTKVRIHEITEEELLKERFNPAKKRLMLGWHDEYNVNGSSNESKTQHTFDASDVNVNMNDNLVMNARLDVDLNDNVNASQNLNYLDYDLDLDLDLDLNMNYYANELEGDEGNGNEVGHKDNGNDVGHEGNGSKGNDVDDSEEEEEDEEDVDDSDEEEDEDGSEGDFKQDMRDYRLHTNNVED